MKNSSQKINKQLFKPIYREYDTNITLVLTELCKTIRGVVQQQKINAIFIHFVSRAFSNQRCYIANMRYNFSDLKFKIFKNSNIRGAD